MRIYRASNCPCWTDRPSEQPAGGPSVSSLAPSFAPPPPVISTLERLEALFLLLLQGPPLPRVDQSHAERVVTHVVLAQRRRS